MINKVWNELGSKGLLDEDSDKFEVGNTVLNFARDFEKVSEQNKGKVLELIKHFFGDGSVEISSDPGNWTEITDGLWQSTVKPDLFSTDGGKTYYSCNDSERKIHTSVK